MRKAATSERERGRKNGQDWGKKLKREESKSRIGK